MSSIFRYASAFAVAVLVGIWSPTAWPLDLSQKVGLQAAMQRHIDAQSIDGTFLYLDMKTGAVRPLHPVTAHPMILRMGKHFVLCFDFRDDKGSSVQVDFYLARKRRSYVVFHTAIASRHILKRLMAVGRVVHAD